MNPGVVQARYAAARAKIGAEAFDRELADFREWQRTVQAIHAARAAAAAAEAAEKAWRERWPRTRTRGAS